MLDGRELRTWRQSRSLVSVGSGEGFATSSQKTRKQGDSREVCSALVHVTNYVIKASLRPYVSVPNVFPKQQNFLSGELVSPAVLVLPYMLLKGLKRWQGEMQLRGENPALRSPGNVSTVSPCLERTHFPAVCVHTQRLELENPWM